MATCPSKNITVMEFRNGKHIKITRLFIDNLCNKTAALTKRTYQSCEVGGTISDKDKLEVAEWVNMGHKGKLPSIIQKYIKENS